MDRIAALRRTATIDSDGCRQALREGPAKGYGMVQRRMLPYRVSLAGLLLAARESVMAPIRPYLRDAGVTEQQWRVLRVLADEGPLDLSTLAEHALLHAPSVTRIIKEVADRGLIIRTIDKADKRRSILQLTKSGEDLVFLTSQLTLKVLDSYSARFGAERLGALRQELHALIDMIAEDALELDDLTQV